jgi:hypothetical protein
VWQVSDALLIRQAARFFHEHAGYVVGESMRGALAHARAERDARAAGVTFEWSEDPTGYDVLGDLECCKEAERHATWARAHFDNGLARRIESGHRHEVEDCLAMFRGEVLASLGGIVDADSDYRRVIQAELALEAMGEIDARQAYPGVSVEGSR